MEKSKSQIIRVRSWEDVPCVRWQPPRQHFRYNAPTSNGRKVWRELYGEKLKVDPYVYHHTEDKIGEIFFEDEVIADFNEGLTTYCSREGVPRIKFSGEPLLSDLCTGFAGEAMGLVTALDRTIEHPPATPGIYTKRFVAALQGEFFLKHPLWRIQVCETAREADYSIYVYPHAVCIAGERYAGSGSDGAFERWQEAARDRIESSYMGSQDRLIHFTRDLLPSIEDQLASAASVAVPLFWQLEDERDSTLWLACRGTRMLNVEVDERERKPVHFVTSFDGISINSIPMPKSSTSIIAHSWLGDESWERIPIEVGEIPQTSVLELRAHWPSIYF